MQQHIPVRKAAVIISSVSLAVFITLFFNQVVDVATSLIPGKAGTCLRNAITTEVSAQEACVNITNVNSVAVWDGRAGNEGKIRESKVYENFTSGRLGVNTSNPVSTIDSVATSSGNVVGLFVYNTSGTANTESASIQMGRANDKPMGEVRAGNTTSASFANGYLSFLTRTSESMTEKMRIDSAGNVGIGTSSPSSISKLDINAGTAGAGWASWNQAINFSNGNNNAIRSGNLLFGMNTDNNFYWANTSTGLYTMQLGPTGNLRLRGTNGIIDCMNWAGNQWCPANGVMRLTPNLHLNAQATYAVIANWDNGTTGTSQAFRVGNGAGADAWFVRADGLSNQTSSIQIDGNTVIDDGGGWHRSYGATGWYNNTYGGGIFMQDSSYVRVYGSKIFYNDNFIQSDSSVRAPIFYDSQDTGFYIDPNGNSLVNLIYFSNGNFRISRWSGNNAFEFVNTSGGTISEVTSAADAGWAWNVWSARLGVGLAYIEGDGDMWLRRARAQNSDIRRKKDIQPLESSLDKVLKLNGVSYLWKDDPSTERSLGYVAQDIQTVIPEVVKEDKDGYLSVAYTSIIPVISEAVKELHGQFVAFKTDVKTKFVQLEARLNVIDKKQLEQEALIKQQQQVIEQQQKQIDALERKMDQLDVK